MVFLAARPISIAAARLMPCQMQQCSHPLTPAQGPPLRERLALEKTALARKIAYLGVARTWGEEGGNCHHTICLQLNTFSAD